MKNITVLQYYHHPVIARSPSNARATWQSSGSYNKAYELEWTSIGLRRRQQAGFSQ